MPWVNQDMCDGCGICVAECPVGAATIQPNEKARINDEECIRCGKCHDVCPQEAVRHDSERIPADVGANLARTKDFLKHYHTRAEQKGFLERTMRYYNKERKVAEQTMDRIKAMQTELE